MKKVKSKKKNKKGCYYTPCENCGGSKYECSCFQDDDIDTDLDYSSDED